MRTDTRYHLLLVVFGFTVACAIMADSRWLMGDLSALWAACCMSLESILGRDIATWLASLSQTAVISLLLFGLGVFVQRLWKTRRFIVSLNSAVAIPSARLVRLFESLDLSKHVVVLATEAPLALCFGSLRPRICLSIGLANTLNDKELEAVLLHENHHRRCYDPLRSLLAQTLGTALFFLPVVAELRDLFVTSTELAADRHAARVVGRAALAAALHKILTHPQATYLPDAVGISSLSATGARIAQLLDDSVPAWHLSTRSLISSSAILILICVFALM